MTNFRAKSNYPQLNGLRDRVAGEGKGFPLQREVFSIAGAVPIPAARRMPEPPLRLRVQR